MWWPIINTGFPCKKTKIPYSLLYNLQLFRAQYSYGNEIKDIARAAYVDRIGKTRNC
jgi:hypothetical protein